MVRLKISKYRLQINSKLREALLLSQEFYLRCHVHQFAVLYTRYFFQGLAASQLQLLADTMTQFTRLVVITAWVGLAQARNETIVHGWQPEPSGRGTWSIVWSCLTTVLLCTWSALHLPVPDWRTVHSDIRSWLPVEMPERYDKCYVHCLKLSARFCSLDASRDPLMSERIIHGEVNIGGCSPGSSD